MSPLRRPFCPPLAIALLRPWGPCPYHLPSGTKALGPLPEPLYLPPPHRASFKKRHFAFGPPSPSPCTLPHPTMLQKKKIFLKNTTQVAGPVPLPPTPPAPNLDPPRAPDLRPSLATLWNQAPTLPLFWNCLSTTPALGPCPYHLPRHNRSP